MLNLKTRICRFKCHEKVNWEPEVIATMTNKNKRKLAYDLKVREALEIRRHNCGPGKSLNEDMGAYVKTTMWNPVFHKLHNDEGERRGGPPLIGSFCSLNSGFFYSLNLGFLSHPSSSSFL